MTDFIKPIIICFIQSKDPAIFLDQKFNEYFVEFSTDKPFEKNKVSYVYGTDLDQIKNLTRPAQNKLVFVMPLEQYARGWTKEFCQEHSSTTDLILVKNSIDKYRAEGSLLGHSSVVWVRDKDCVKTIDFIQSLRLIASIENY